MTEVIHGRTRRAMRRASLLAIACVSALAAAAVPASAATQRYASPTSTNTIGTCTEFQPCRIDHAVNNAGPDDEVIVQAGVHNTPVALNPLVAVNIRGVGAERPEIKTTANLKTPMILMTAGGSLRHLKITGGTKMITAVEYEAAVAEDLDVYNPLGTAITLNGSSTTTTVFRNSVARSGAAMHAIQTKAGKTSGGTAMVINVTSWNTASGSSALKSKLYSGTTIARNSILRGEGEDIGAQSPAQIQIDHSNFRPGMSNNFVEGAGNETADPAFLDAASLNFRPAAGSNTIDTGTTDAAIGTADADGKQRAMGAAVDVGAYEFEPPPAADTPSKPDEAPASDPAAGATTDTSEDAVEPPAPTSEDLLEPPAGASADPPAETTDAPDSSSDTDTSSSTDTPSEPTDAPAADPSSSSGTSSESTDPPATDPASGSDTGSPPADGPPAEGSDLEEPIGDLTGGLDAPPASSDTTSGDSPSSDSSSGTGDSPADTTSGTDGSPSDSSSSTGDAPANSGGESGGTGDGTSGGGSVDTGTAPDGSGTTTSDGGPAGGGTTTNDGGPAGGGGTTDDSGPTGGPTDSDSDHADGGGSITTPIDDLTNELLERPISAAPLPAAAPPVSGASVTVGELSGTVRIRQPGGKQFIELRADASIPVGSTIDAQGGVVELTSARDAAGTPQTGQFWGSAFLIQQRTGDVTELQLVGGDFRDCAPRSVRSKAQRAARGAGARSARARRRGRKLWGRDRHGRFRTRGRNGAATVRGTHWLTEDRCDGTFFKVREGAIEVRPNGARAGVLLRAGQSRLVAARAARRSARGSTQKPRAAR